MTASWQSLIRTALPAPVTLGPGTAGLPCLRVANKAAQAAIYLQGAPDLAGAGRTGTGHLDEPRERLAPGTPIRGGVPICCPWFGANPIDAKPPMHGFARTADWALVDAREDGDAVTLAFLLADSAGTRAFAWPHAFEATYRVTIGTALLLSLEIANTDSRAVSYQEALHCYYAVADIRDVTVTGLEGAAYVDRLAGPEPRQQGVDPIRFTGESDRVYVDTAAATTIHDPRHRRRISIGKDGSASTVVWNPWIDKAGAMADFGDDEWTRMLCVETCNVHTAAITLEPGARHTMSAAVEVAPFD